jgi:hypothetical protein
LDLVSTIWTPYLAGWQPLMQVPILLVGLIAAIAFALNTARQLKTSSRAALPIVAFCMAFTGVMIWLYV